MPLKNNHTLLLVDDEIAITRALQRLFRKEGYNILTAENGAQGLETLMTGGHQVSLIISDQRMPQMSGAVFLERTRELAPDAMRFLLTGYSDMEAVIQAVNNGQIHRYLTKPWNDDDLLLHVRHSLEHYELIMENRRLTALTIKQNKALAEVNEELEQKVLARTKEIQKKNKALVTINQMLENSLMDAVRLLVSTVETVNPRLGGQLRKVAQLARQTGETMGLAKPQLDEIEMAGWVHDIGLMGMSDEIWLKEPKHLSKEQARLFSEHPVIASVILENVEKLAGVGEIVLFHHEQFDGQGFPNGAGGDHIPLGSRIIAAVSEYYRIIEIWPRDMKKLIGMTRRHFDADVWKTFAIEDDPEPIIEEAAEKNLLMDQNGKYDAQVVSALIKTLRRVKRRVEIYSVDLCDLEEGMVLMEDLRVNDGRLLLSRGTRLKQSSVISIQGIGERGMIPTKLSVSIPGEQGASQ